jgi:hypothetical protein
MPRGVYERSGAPVDEPPGATPPSDDDIPSLVVPQRVAPNINLDDPADSPDLPDGEWSRAHLTRFLARQPYSVVFIPKQQWEPKNEDTFQTVGFQGHWFSIRKGRPESVPIQIATVIEQSQEEFPTFQSQARRRQLTDIRDLPQSSASRGVPGAEVDLGR